MADLYNFNKHVTEIIKPVAKEMGFSKKNLNFRRKNGLYYEEINIQRSQFNFTNQCQFFINLYWYSNDEYKKWFYSVRLPNHTKMECPKRYKEYYADFSSEFRKTFSPAEEAEIHKYMEATCWHYDSEQKLIVLLNDLAFLLKNNADDIFKKMEEIFDEKNILQIDRLTYDCYEEIRTKYRKMINYCTYVN